MTSLSTLDPTDWANHYLDHVIVPGLTPSYVREWFERGRDADDPIIAFMMYWITFNWLYSQCDAHTERAKIRQFCHDNYYTMSRFDAFSSRAYFEFKKGPVGDGRYGEITPECNRLYSDLTGKCSQKKHIEFLILTLYQVRCNLFHGSKRLSILGDLRLICAAAIIMEGYLTVLLNEI